MAVDTQYEQLLRRVLETGVDKADRTGTGTLSLFGERLRYDLSTEFPLITTKRVHFKSVAVELLWFLRGDSNTAYLRENGVTIWDEWADANGDLGPVYGHQWRAWPTPDGGSIHQITYALLTRMIADQVGLAPGDFIWVGGDCHIYANHLEQVREQLTREAYPFPRLELAPAPSLFDYTYDHFKLLDYQHHPALRAPVAV